MSRTAAALCATVLVSLAAPAAGAQPLGPASLTPCSALPLVPGGSEADFRCSITTGWSQPFTGRSDLRVAPSGFDGVQFASARYQFNDGALRRIDFVWQGSFEAIDGLLRSRRGAASDSSWSGRTFVTYPDVGDGWQVTLDGVPGGNTWTVTYIDRRTLWN